MAHAYGHTTVPDYQLPPPVTLHHQRRSNDRNTHASTSYVHETHLGSPPGVVLEVDPGVCLAPTTPFTTRSVVTTTTTITTTITTNTTAHGGDVSTSYQPWYATEKRTDVHEATTVHHESDVLAIGNSSVLEVVPTISAPETRLRSVEAAADGGRGGSEKRGRRRRFHETDEMIHLATVTDHAIPHRKARRKARPLTYTRNDEALHSRSPAYTFVDAVLAPLSTQAPSQTPTALLRLSHPPNPSDLIIIRLITLDLDGSEVSAGEFLSSISPKRSCTASGEILVSPISLPPSLSHISISQCRLSFSWLIGDRIRTTLITNSLGTHESPSKRPKLQ